jgi:hypothetical protein
VDREVPFKGLRFIIDHAETITLRNIERVRALGGGIAIQHRMAYQGEDFVARYGADAAQAMPPVRRMMEAGVPVGAGTDATRVASYNPWVALYWLVTGRTVGGLALYDERNRLEREQALRLWTEGSAWFSGEDAVKGRLTVGRHADFALLSGDYITVPEAQIKELTCLLTVVGGRVVHGSGPFAPLAPELPPPMPDWAPVAHFGGYQAASIAQARQAAAGAHAHHHGDGCAVHGHAHAAQRAAPVQDLRAFWGAVGCACFAF